MARSKVSKTPKPSPEPPRPASKPDGNARRDGPAGSGVDPSAGAAPGGPAAAAIDQNGKTQAAAAAEPSGARPNPKGHAAEIAARIKELVRLAQEQGYLTYSDITDSLPEALVTPEDLDEIYIKLRNLEVAIVDQAEVDRVKQP